MKKTEIKKIYHIYNLNMQYVSWVCFLIYFLFVWQLSLPSPTGEKILKKIISVLSRCHFHLQVSLLLLSLIHVQPPLFSKSFLFCLLFSFPLLHSPSLSSSFLFSSSPGFQSFHTNIIAELSLQWHHLLTCPCHKPGLVGSAGLSGS